MTDAEALAELERILSDDRERLNTLYAIVNKEGTRVPFRMNPTQARLYSLLEEGKKRIIIPKSRALGYTSFIARYCLDRTHFKRDWFASLVADNEKNARKLFKNHIRAPLRDLQARAPELLHDVTYHTSNESGYDTSLGSGIYAGITVRGGLNQLLHMSELGVIAHEDHARAEELITGGIPTAESGVVIIESTFKGGKGGVFYNLIQEGLRNSNLGATGPKDWMVLFSPWWEDPAYCDPVSSMTHIHPYVEHYFKKLKVNTLEGPRVFSNGQICWFNRQYSTYGLLVHQEYPSVLEECWMVSQEGSIYGPIIDRLKIGNKITRVEYDAALPTYAVFDLGFGDATAIWVFQPHGNAVMLVDYYENCNHALKHYSDWLNTRPLRPELLILPHDARKHNLEHGTCSEQILQQLGWKTVVVPRIEDEWIGINEARQLLERCYFSAHKCEMGIDVISQFRKRWNKGKNCYDDAPLHDKYSHGAASFRYIAEASMAGLIPRMGGAVVTRSSIPPGAASRILKSDNGVFRKAAPRVNY